MGKTKQHPRYNVLSFRASDDELALINSALKPGENIGDLLRQAAQKMAYSRTVATEYAEYLYRQREQRQGAASC